MSRTSAALIVALGLSACAQTPSTSIPMIENGMPVVAAPITFFHQGVKGDMNRDASVSTATFSFMCDANFEGGGNLQQRANASAQYSKIAQDKVLYWLVNSMVTRGLLREVNQQSAAAQGCSATKVDLATITTDPAEVMKFAIENQILGKIMDMR